MLLVRASVAQPPLVPHHSPREALLEGVIFTPESSSTQLKGLPG